MRTLALLIGLVAGCERGNHVPSIQSSERPRPATHHPTGPASWRRRTSFARAPSSNATPVAAEASVAILEEALASKDYESRIIAGRRSVRRLGELTPGSRNPLGTRNHDFRMFGGRGTGQARNPRRTRGAHFDPATTSPRNSMYVRWPPPSS